MKRYDMTINIFQAREPGELAMAELKPIESLSGMWVRYADVIYLLNKVADVQRVTSETLCNLIKKEPQA